MQKLYAIILAALSLHAFAEEHPAKKIRLKIPTTFFIAKNEADTTNIDLGSGINVDFFFLHAGRFLFGPGIALFGSFPTASGNRAVSVKPFYLMSELHLVSAVDLFDRGYGFSPYISLGGQVGSLIVDKAVNRQHRLDVITAYGGAASTGLVYWLDSVGIGLSYGVSLTNVALRHKAELSLELALF